MDQCLWKVLGVRRDDEWMLLSEDHCKPDRGASSLAVVTDVYDWQACASGHAAYHPFKSVETYQACLRHALGQSGVPQDQGQSGRLHSKPAVRSEREERHTDKDEVPSGTRLAFRAAAKANSSKNRRERADKSPKTQDRMINATRAKLEKDIVVVSPRTSRAKVASVEPDREIFRVADKLAFRADVTSLRIRGRARRGRRCANCTGTGNRTSTPHVMFEKVWDVSVAGMFSTTVAIALVVAVFAALGCWTFLSCGRASSAPPCRYSRLVQDDDDEGRLGGSAVGQLPAADARSARYLVGAT